MISSKQRSKLRSLAHHLKPLINIGKAGITDGCLKSISEALDSHELIKIKFLQNKAAKKNLKDRINNDINASIIGEIGNTLIVYRQNQDKDKRKYSV